MDETNLQADRKLLNTLLGIDPLRWSRRDNGDLVYLNSVGQKFVLTYKDIQKLIDKKLAEKAAYQPKPGPKSKTKELTKEQAPYDAEK